MAAVHLSGSQKITGMLGMDEERERSRHRRVEPNPRGETWSIVARALWEAEHTATPIESIANVIPDLSVADGYAIRREVDLLRMIDGAVPVGRKVGLATRQGQLKNGLDEPFWSYLFSTGEVPEGSTIDLRHYIHPMAEVEVAIKLGLDLDAPDLQPEDVSQAISALYPTIEIVDARTLGWNEVIAEAIADSGMHAGFIIGQGVQNDGSIDLAGITARMRADHTGPTPLGRTSELVGGPLGILTWLARKLVESGEPLRSGETIFTGTLVPPVALKPGNHYTAEFAGFGDILGIVRLSTR